MDTDMNLHPQRAPADLRRAPPPTIQGLPKPSRRNRGCPLRVPLRIRSFGGPRSFHDVAGARGRIDGVIPPSASYSFIVRLQITNRPGMLGRVASAIGDAGGDIGAVDLVETTRERTERDITIKARDSVHAQRIVSRLRRVAGVRTRSEPATTSRWRTHPGWRASASRSETIGSRLSP